MDNLYKEPGILEKHIKNLAEDLIPNLSLREDFINNLKEKPKEFLKAKLASLLPAPRKYSNIYY